MARPGASRHLVLRWPCIALAICSITLLAACNKNRQTTLTKPPPPIASGKTPEYATVAEAYNGRVEPLSRLWTRATIRIWYPNREGEEETAQLDGNLQYVRPDRVNLTLSHAAKSDPVAVLGSNERQYWYIDLSGKEKVAKIGDHSKATPERVGQLGLPVYPLDLIELIGISPLPTSWPSVGTGETPDLRWSEDGRSLIVTTPSRTGRRRLYLDPITYKPTRVELTGPGGVVLASADLSAYEDPVGAPGAAVPTEVLASVDQGRTRVRLRMNVPEFRHPVKPIAFDFDALAKAYGITGDIVSLDETPVAAGR